MARARENLAAGRSRSARIDHANGVERHFSYDSLSRLVQSVRGPGDAATAARTYELDGAQNRLRARNYEWADPGSVPVKQGLITYARDALAASRNAISSVSSSSERGTAAERYALASQGTRSYDDAGNLAKRALGMPRPGGQFFETWSRQYTYDHANRLSETSESQTQPLALGRMARPAHSLAAPPQEAPSNRGKMPLLHS